MNVERLLSPGLPGADLHADARLLAERPQPTTQVQPHSQNPRQANPKSGNATQYCQTKVFNTL